MASTISVPVSTRASQAWAARDAAASGISTVLLMNTDLVNTVTVGNAINALVVPIAPNGSLSVDPGENWYVVGPVAGAGPLVVVPNGQSNFLGLTQGLGSLAIPSVFSPNFITGVSGWRIAKDGSAEFNNLVIRGTFFGTDFIISSKGIFFYSGVPAAGNLFMYWTLAAGTDTFGNNYNQGLYIGNPSGNTPQVALIPSTGGPSNPAVAQFPLSPASSFSNQPNIQAISPGGNGQLIVSGPGLSLAGFIDFVQDVYSTSVGAVPAARQTNYKDINNILHTYLNISSFGAVLPAATINAPDPTTGTIGTPAVSEGWHAITLDANWSTLPGQPVPSYRFLADGGRTIVELVAAAQFNVNIASTNLNAGSPLPGTAPGNGYRPLTQIFLAGAPGAAGAAVNTNGVITAAQSPGQATVFFNVNGKYPVNL